MYKVRRKLDLKLMEEDFKTVALWKTDLDETNVSCHELPYRLCLFQIIIFLRMQAKTTGISQNGQESFFASSENVNVVSSVDPRNQDLGHRAIVPKDFDIHSLFPSEDHKVTLEPTSDRFTEKR